MRLTRKFCRLIASAGALSFIFGLIGITSATTGAFASPFVPGVIDTVAVGSGPEFISAGSGHVFVSDRYDDTITVIDETSHLVVDSLILPTGVYPRASVVANNTLYIATFNGNQLFLFNATTLQSLGTLTVGLRPNALAVCGNELYVGNYSSPDVHVIDTSTRTLATGFTNPLSSGLGATQAICSGNYVYLSNSLSDTVTLIDRTTHTAVQSQAVGLNPMSLGVANGSIFVSGYNADTVTVLSATTGNVTATISVGANPSAVATVGNDVYIANEGGSSVDVIDATTNQLAVGFPNPIPNVAGAHQFIPIGNALYSLNVSGNTISILNTATHLVDQVIPMSGMPYMGVSSGEYLYVTDNSANTVTIIQTDPSPVVPPTPELPQTGTDMSQLILGAVLMLGFGLGLTLTRRIVRNTIQTNTETV